MKKKLASIIFLVALFTLIFSTFVFATTFSDKVDSITENVKIAATALVTLSAVVVAVMYMGSSVNPKLKDQAKAALLGLIIGVVVLVFAKDLANMIASAVSGSDLGSN
jgi:formate hydrogenlyase subunit 3/multisubunit Na+/H+ antiporter MnhD subunit